MHEINPRIPGCIPTTGSTEPRFVSAPTELRFRRCGGGGDVPDSSLLLSWRLTKSSRCNSTNSQNPSPLPLLPAPSPDPARAYRPAHSGAVWSAALFARMSGSVGEEACDVPATELSHAPADTRGSSDRFRRDFGWGPLPGHHQVPA